MHRHHTVCLVLDLPNPGMNGLELHQLLAAAWSRGLIIFAAAGSDEVARPQVFQAGALDFLQKPFREKPLLQAVQVALGDQPGRVPQRVPLGRFTMAASSAGTARHILTGTSLSTPGDRAGRRDEVTT